jgi:hypothetical protein
MQAKRDNLTASPLAGHNYRQVYSAGDTTQAPDTLDRGAAACAPAAQRSGVAGRLHAVLGAAGGTSALPANLHPNLQSKNRARIRLSAVYSLTAFIRLQTVLGRLLT